MSIEHLIEIAATIDPPPKIAGYCGQYYSPYYYLMHMLARRPAVHVCVELGIEQGRGLLSFASASPDVRVVGIDSLKRQEIDTLVSQFPNIEIHVQSSTPAFDLGRPIDVLHVDTEHSYTRARDEFWAWEPYLADHAVVLFDDMNAMDGGVARAFEELPGEHYRDDRLHPVCGYGVLVYER